MRKKINYIIRNWDHRDFLDRKGKYLLVKRIIDFSFSLFLLILFSPLFLLIIILNLPQPFFFQKRIGKDGREFLLFKFRTMKEIPGFNNWNTLPDDPRITKIGKVLRKTSLDELPQLINILKGEMSFIGPRPDLPRQINVLKKKEKEMRLAVLPGLTGLSQILGRSSLSYPKRLYYDLKYVQKINWDLDIYILFKTFFQLFKFFQAR